MKKINEQLARKVLGVNPSDSFEEIKRKYHRLILKHHPDQNNNNPESIKKCQLLIEAYSSLREKKGEAETPEDLNIRSYIWNLFQEFWPVPAEFQSPCREVKRDIALRLTHEPSYEEFIKQRGFYDCVC